MQSKPLISIIVPVYNVERYIHRCIDSILAQTYCNFELLLIDDGTLDRSGDICDEYAVKESRIRVFHQANGGVSSARNIGLDRAVGDWIAFADSDDWVKKEWLSEYVLEIEKGEKVDLIFQGFIISKNGVESVEQIIERRFFASQDFIMAYMYLDRELGLFGYTWSKIYRAEIFHQYNLKFNEAISFGEDLELALDFMAKIDGLSVIDRFNYVYSFDCETTLSRRYHSYVDLTNLSNMLNDHLVTLEMRGDHECSEVFDSVAHYRFRALKSLYRPLRIKSSLERRNIIDTYSKCYYEQLSKANVYRGNERLIVRVLGLKYARLIDFIYSTMFWILSKVSSSM